MVLFQRDRTHQPISVAKAIYRKARGDLNDVRQSDVLLQMLVSTRRNEDHDVIKPEVRDLSWPTVLRSPTTAERRASRNVITRTAWPARKKSRSFKSW